MVVEDVPTADVLRRARTGDADAFRALTEPHRQELHVHCYRMLGSLQDAEDALQETLLAAWRGLPTFEGRASVRTWLYRIATNRCLNARRSARRRRVVEWDMPGVEPPEPTGRGEVPWLQPYPDAWGARPTADASSAPEARVEQSESISLAFVTALQLLPPRQLAVLVLRDVLGFRTVEVADMLDTSVGSVGSALKRARSRLHRPGSGGEHAPRPGSAEERAIVASFVRAYESGDVDALVSLFTDDVLVSMPPIPLEYVGRDAAARLFTAVFGSGRRVELAPTRANGQPAFVVSLPSASGGRQGSGLFVLTLDDRGIRAFTRFDTDVLPWFHHAGARSSGSTERSS